MQALYQYHRSTAYWVGRLPCGQSLRERLQRVRYIVPRSPRRAQKSSDLRIKFWYCTQGRIRPAPNFGQKIGPSLSEAFFVVALHIIWAKKLDQLSVKTFFFALQLILGKKSEKKIAQVWCWVIDLWPGGLIPVRLGGPISTFVPPVEKLLSEALLVAKLCASALMLVSHKPASSTFFLSDFFPSSHQTF